MSNDIAIRVENLSKAYRIGLKEQQHETMLGAMAAWVKSPFQNFRDVRNLSRFTDVKTEDGRSKMADRTSPNSHLPPPISSSPSDIIWALRDVSFEVKQGEAVGIIGRNGAGKSTLLKILSRITEPTTGRATVYGRVGSLLEVGTGFHPDLTGRENIYLNGTILGMKKREVDARFDEIVAFSGVEKFIDTPVKRYSSGMRVRLGFSVAAHLEPEILIVDEVLAVGDAEFQRKCLGKMQDVAGQGRTVLFVSHNIAAVQALCQRVILLESGSIAHIGTCESAASIYLKADASKDGFRNVQAVRTGERSVTVEDIEMYPKKAESWRPLEFRFHLKARHGITPVPNVEVALSFVDNRGNRLMQVFSKHVDRSFLVDDDTRLSLRLDSLPLVPGSYRLNVWIGRGHEVLEFLTDCFFLTVQPTPLPSGQSAEPRGYPLIIPAEWALLPRSNG
jgi:lipopolysaccharide transport system ATP-binding protein